jgi:hypothetical protein
MNEFSGWMHSNWYELGTLLVEVGFLAAGVWFAGRILRTLRAFQEQFGALLKLSVTDAFPEKHAASLASGRPFGEASPYWLTPTLMPPMDAPQPEESGPSRWAVARHHLVVWLQTPMSSGDDASWRKVVKWLQAPAGS